MNFEPDAWACIDCGARAASAAKCPACNADGMMDLRDAGVLVELIKEDDERQAKRRQVMIWVAVPLTAFAIFALGAGVFGFIVGGALGYGLSLGLAAIFPAKRLFPYARG